MIVFDLSLAKLASSDLTRLKPGAIDGITVFGHRRGRLDQGRGRWSGMFGFTQRSRATPDGRKAMAYIESKIARIKETGEEFRVPMFRNHDLITVTQQVDGAPTSIEGITITVGTGGVLSVPNVSNRIVRIEALDGTRLTLGSSLYLLNGDQVLAGTGATKPVTTPEWPTVSAEEVELLRPFAHGFVMPENAMTMMRRGSWGGPYDVSWIEA